MLDSQIYGSNPIGFHLTNLLLHAANVLASFLLFWRLTRGLWLSSVIAALIAVHPLNVEAVAWIAERKGLLGALFCLLCVHAYLSYCERPGIGRYLVCNALFILGLLAKPIALALPFLLVVLDIVLLKRGKWESGENSRRDSRKWKHLGTLFLEKAPMFLAGLIMIGLTFRAEARVGALSLDHSQSLGYKVAKVINSYWQYVAHIFWPTKLSVLYPLPVSFPFWWTIWSVALFAGLGTIVIVKRDRWGIFGLGWYLILLLPVSGIVQLGVQYAPDRYAYLPMAGLFLITVHVASRWIRPPVMGCACLAVLVLLAFQTSRQIETWRDTLTLFDHANCVTKGNYVALNNVAWILASDPRYSRSPAQQTKALEYAQEACRLTNNNDDRMLETLAVCLAHVGKQAQARKVLLQAASVAQREGRPKEATIYLRERSQYPQPPGEHEWFR